MEELPNPDLVVFKNVLHKNKSENDITNIILKKIVLLGDVSRYKFDAEFLLYICNLAEHLVSKNKFDKKKLVINVVSSVYNLNINEKEVISSLIEFLHSNQLIKKIEKKVDEFFLYKLNAIFPKKNFFQVREKMCKYFKTRNNKYYKRLYCKSSDNSFFKC